VNRFLEEIETEQQIVKNDQTRRGGGKYKGGKERKGNRNRSTQKNNESNSQCNMRDILKCGCCSGPKPLAEKTERRFRRGVHIYWHSFAHTHMHGHAQGQEEDPKKKKKQNQKKKTRTRKDTHLCFLFKCKNKKILVSV